MVHDYEGVAAFSDGRWRPRDEIVAALVNSIHGTTRTRSLCVRFIHQNAHGTVWVARNDVVRYNARADELATAGMDGSQ